MATTLKFEKSSQTDYLHRESRKQKGRTTWH